MMEEITFKLENIEDDIFKISHFRVDPKLKIRKH